MAPRADKYRFGIVPKRNFDPTAPLFVTRRLKFRGVLYERGQQLPDDIGKGKRFALWHSNRATNTPVVHFDRRGRFVADGVPIASEKPVVAAQADSLTEAELEKLTAPATPLPASDSKLVPIEHTPFESVPLPASPPAVPPPRAETPRGRRR